MKTIFNKKLFWDVELKNLNKQKHADFVIERVLNFGEEKDFQKLKKIYSIKKIKKTALKVNYNNLKNINFWSIIFNTPQNLFKCTKKFSIQKQSAFLKR